MKTCEYCYLCECCPAAFDRLAPCPFGAEGGFEEFRRRRALEPQPVAAGKTPAKARPGGRANVLRKARFR